MEEEKEEAEQRRLNCPNGDKRNFKGRWFLSAASGAFPFRGTFEFSPVERVFTSKKTKVKSHYNTYITVLAFLRRQICVSDHWRNSSAHFVIARPWRWSFNSLLIQWAEKISAASLMQHRQSDSCPHYLFLLKPCRTKNAHFVVAQKSPTTGAFWGTNLSPPPPAAVAVPFCFAIWAAPICHITLGRNSVLEVFSRCWDTGRERERLPYWKTPVVLCIENLWVVTCLSSCSQSAQNNSIMTNNCLVFKNTRVQPLQTWIGWGLMSSSNSLIFL